MNFPTEYDQIVARIHRIDPTKYSKTRNFLGGDVTYLSPYLTHGVINLKQVMDLVLAKYSFKQSEKLIFELAWREYFQRVWEVKGDQIFEDLTRPQEYVESQGFPKNVFEQNSGINILDKAVAELYDTGYMHNHARMWTASVICNVGKYDWKLPAKWLYYNLLDGDLASNYLSWQWVAGSFGSKKYYANQENLNKYSNSQQSNTFLDVDYFKIANLERPSILIPEITENEMTLKTDLSSENLQKLTKLKLLSQKDLASQLFVFHPWALDPKLQLQTKSVLFLEKSHFEKFPISQKRLQFILDLAENLDLKGVYVGEIADFSDTQVATIYHPAIKHWADSDNVKVLSREYIFESVSGYFGSFFGYWKKCLKEIEKNPGFYKYH